MPQGKAFFHQHVSKLLNLINVAVPQEPNLLALFLSHSLSPSIPPAPLLTVLLVCSSEMASRAEQIEPVSGRSAGAQ